MRVEVTRSALKDLKRINDPYRQKIKEAVNKLQSFPDLPQIKQLTNHVPKYRMRVGDYRILFDVERDLLTVARILHRQESYR